MRGGTTRQYLLIMAEFNFRKFIDAETEMSTIKPTGGLIRERATKRDLHVFEEHIVRHAQTGNETSESA